MHFSPGYIMLAIITQSAKYPEVAEQRVGAYGSVISPSALYSALGLMVLGGGGILFGGGGSGRGVSHWEIR